VNDIPLVKQMFSKLKSSFLFVRERPVADAKDVIAWWEARRPLYNLMVGLAGLLSCMVIASDLLATAYVRHAEVEGPDPPIFVVFGIVAYGVGANMCYTLGWLAELATRKILPGQSERLAVLSFKIGLVFSVFLTLIPGFVFAAFGIIELWPHIFGNGQH
jgi:hypothetical protein